MFNQGVHPGQWLARSASATGTAVVSGSASLGYLPGTADGRGWRQLLWYAECSGNPASAALHVHPFNAPADGPWPSATAFALEADSTGTGQLVGHYPFTVLALTWVSGGARTATVNFHLAGGP